jgi:hypothetical protein
VFVKKRTQGKFIAMLAIALPVAIVLLASPSSYAQSTGTANNSANTLKVSPVRTDIEILPGESKTVPVTVTNLTNAPVSVASITNDFVAGDDRGTPALILDADKFAPSHSLKRFMTPLADMTIPAKQAKTVNVMIRVPATAQAGGYFGAIRFAPSDPDSGGQVNLSASVASLILLTVPGDTVEKISLESFDIQQKGNNGTLFNSPNDLQTSFSFENKGNLQIGPFGILSVKQGDKVVYQTTFNDQNPRDVILPDSTRRWEIPLEDIGTFGHYDVVATFTYGTKNQTIEVTKSFWVIPQWVIFTAIGVLVGLLLIIALVVFLVIRSRKRRHMPRSNRRR